MKSTNLSSYQNKWYRPGSMFQILLWNMTSILFFENGLIYSFKIKRALLRMFGCTVGKKVIIKPRVKIKYPWKLSIGNYSWIGENVWIDNLDTVYIGNNVCISQRAFVLCGNHDYTKSSFDLMIKPIIIEDGAWIGANAMVGPGVKVGNHAVLSIGSIATSDLEHHKIYRGNPSVFIKKRIIALFLALILYNIPISNLF